MPNDLLQEELGRFVIESGRLTAENRVKPKAFEPSYGGAPTQLEVSVCRTREIADSRLRHLGQTKLPKLAKAVIIIRWHELTPIAGLQAFSDPVEDFPEHAVIVGWDANDKSQRLEQQQQLALQIKPSDVVIFD